VRRLSGNPIPITVRLDYADLSPTTSVASSSSVKPPGSRAGYPHRPIRSLRRGRISSPKLFNANRLASGVGRAIPLRAKAVTSVRQGVWTPVEPDSDNAEYNDDEQNAHHVTASQIRQRPSHHSILLSLVGVCRWRGASWSNVAAGRLPVLLHF
jgi:hypothetical protein